jgi:hypothetical protein
MLSSQNKLFISRILDDSKVMGIILNYINILRTLGLLRALEIFISKFLDAIDEQKNLLLDKAIIKGLLCTIFLFGLLQIMGGLAIVSNVWAENDDDDDDDDDDGPIQLGDLQTPVNRGKNVQGDLLQGTPIGETIEGSDHSETIMGLQGNDVIYGKGGDDILYGDEEDDLVYGGAGDDLLNGGTGDNKLDGEGRNDILIGGDTMDILSGGPGNDKLYGFNGNDVLKGGEGSNEFNCGEGIDTVLDYVASRDLLANDCEIVNQG